MANKNNNTAQAGISFPALLALVFITLKLTKVINWSWWLVLLPIWIPFAIGIVCLIIYLFVKLLKL